MTADGTPTAKGAPQFLGAGAPATAADMNTIAQWSNDNIDASVPTFADLATLPNVWVGMHRTVIADNGDYAYCGATLGWVRLSAAGASPFAEAAGVATYGGTGGSSSSILFWDSPVTVTFPVGRFTVPPLVLVSGNATAGTVVWPWVTAPPTSTNVLIAGLRIGAAPLTSMSFSWHAIQMTAASAAG